MKYSVKYDWHGERETHKYIVTIDGIMNNIDIIVKDKSRDLRDEFYNKETCRIKDYGNGYKVKLSSGKKIQLEYDEAMDMVTAFLALYRQDYKIRIKERV